MAGSSVIGALRVNLGLDSAQFETGVGRVKKQTVQLTLGVETIGRVIGRAIRQIGGFAFRAADEIDRVAKSAQRLGSSIGGFRALELAAGEAGVPLAQITDAAQM